MARTARPAPGRSVEALIASTGLRFGAYWHEHKCGPECVRSRPISKRFRETVEAWAAESLQPEIAKELCDANEADLFLDIGSQIKSDVSAFNGAATAP